MSLIIGIDSILNRNIVEDERLEFKEGWNPEPVLHTICAFANDIRNINGGYIVIGMRDRGNAVGVDPKSIDGMNRKLFDILKMIEPHCDVETGVDEIDGKTVFIIWVPAGRRRPYSCPRTLSKKSDIKGIYIRKLSSTALASNEEIRELLSVSADVPFDDIPNPDATISDISRDLIDGYLGRVNRKMSKAFSEMSTDEILERMHLTTKMFEQVCYRNAALMFFSREPERFFESAWIEATYKPDPTGKDMVEKICKGPLDSQIMQAMDFVNQYAIQRRTIKIEESPIAERPYSYPPDAVEEAITNAVLHKNYRIHRPVSIIIESTRITIKSYPGPYRDITDRDLEDGIMVSDNIRNGRVANMLKELGLAEARNTGIPLIHQSMIMNGSEKPKLITDEDRTMFKIVLNIHRSFLSDTSATDVKIHRNSEQMRAAVLSLLSSEEMTVREISDRLGYRIPPSTLRAAIQVLISERAIEYTESSRNSPKQKLRLRLRSSLP
jgi:ATP-dependent DNA helicase RecG